MGTLLLLICLLLILFNLAVKQIAGFSLRLFVLKAVLVFSVITLVIIESLSFAKQLSYSGLFLCWGIVALMNAGFLYTKRSSISNFISLVKSRFKAALSNLTIYEKVMLIVISAVLTIVFIQGLVYPPNNYDSLTYHMARIPNWLANHSVAHYPTGSVRQLYQPPFSEYLIMQLDVLNRNDIFSASIQYVFFLLAAVALTYVAKQMGLGKKYQLIILMLSFTLPEALLQAASTQNDIVVSFFIIAACIFCYKAVKEQGLGNYLCVGAATGLAILTKGTAYVYVAPILFIFGLAVVYKVFTAKNGRFLGYAIVSAIIVIFINGSFYYRNYKLYNNLLGVDKKESQMYSNQKMSPVLFISTLVKNAGLHMGIIYANKMPAGAEKVIYDLHHAAGVDINDPDVNYLNMRYTLNSPVTHEDSAPNLIHFLLISVAWVMFCILMIRKNTNKESVLLWLIFTLQLSFFCLYLKWQPWHTRLQMPMFLIALPVIAYVCSQRRKFNGVTQVSCSIVLIFSLFTVLHNATRPFGKKLFDDRYKNMFFAKPDPTYAEYAMVDAKIKAANDKNVGLWLGGDDWEYPLFTDAFSTKRYPVHLFVDNASSKLKPLTMKVDCIVSTKTNQPYIDYNGKRYYNRTTDNKVIYYYN